MSRKLPSEINLVNRATTPPYQTYLTRRQAKLTMIGGGRDMTKAGSKELEAAQDSTGRESIQHAFLTVEASLRAENWFFETVRKKLAEAAPLNEFPTIMGSNGHNYLLHFTQFLFFLKALDCTDADQIANFIASHNAKIEALLASPDFTKSPNEFRKALIRPERKAKILDTVRSFNMPIFAIYEYGHLLIDDMSPKTTEKLIEDLRFGKLLERRIDERMSADQKRILIASNGFLEDTYRVSLLIQRRMIAESISEEEFRGFRSDT